MSAGEAWIATRADGIETELRDDESLRLLCVDDEAAPDPAAIVELRRKGEPSRAQMRAALERCEKYLHDELASFGVPADMEWMDEAARQYVATVEGDYAAVRAALGHDVPAGVRAEYGL